MSLEAGRCAGCGRVQFRGACCAHCGGALQIEAISGRGKIYSYTRVHVGPVASERPYLLVLVELEGGGRVMGRLEGNDRAQLDVGVPVVFSRMTDGGPWFLPGAVSDRTDERKQARGDHR